MFVAVKCGWFPSLDSDERGRSFIASGVGGGVVDGMATDEELAHRDGHIAGDSIKRSRDYRTSSRFNVTTSAAAFGATTSKSTSTTLLTLFMTIWTSSSSTCHYLIVAVSSK